MQTSEQDSTHQLRKDVFSVNGMTCEKCVQHIEKELHHVHGVKKAQIDLQKARAYVEYDSCLANREALMQAIRDAGYDVAVDEGGEWPFTQH